MIPLSDQRIVITGAAQGLGAGIARHFAEAGADLLLIDHNGDGVKAVAQETGAESMVLDLADADATRAALPKIAERPVHALIHNAAILRPEPFDEVSFDTFRATVDVGIQAGFLLAQAVWPGMKAAGGGALVFVSSQSGIKGFVDETAYCIAKHGLEGFSKCLAMEGEAHGILSCTVTPGMFMHTPMSERVYTPDLKEKWVDPVRLAPGFAHIVTSRDMALSGQRLSAWDLSQGEGA